MRKALLLLLLFAGYTTSIHSQYLHTERRTVVFKFTADWCPPCGEWGWDLHDSLARRQKTDSNYKAYTIAVHDQNSNQTFLQSSIGSLLAGIMKPAPVQAFPSFTVDNQNMTDVVSWLDFDTTFTNVFVDRAIDSIEQYIAIETAQPAVAALGFDATITTTDSLYVKTKFKFLQNATGDYRLAVYVIEDSVMAFQQEQTGMVPHHLILREPMETNAWGYQLPGTTFTTNTQAVYTYKMKIPASWNKSRLYYMLILYKVDVQNITAEVANVYMSNKLTKPSPTSIIDLEKNAVSIFPNPTKEYVNIRFSEKNDYIITLANLSGKNIGNLYKGQINDGETKKLLLPTALPSGVYFIKLITPQATYNHRILIE